MTPDRVTDVALAPFGGWPILLFLIALVALMTWALCRCSALADAHGSDFYRRDVVELDVIDLELERETSLLGTWTFFDWREDAPELVE